MGNLKDRIHRLVDAYNREDWSAASELCADDIEVIEPLLEPFKGRQAVIDFLKGQKATFPDSTIVVKRLVEEGDTVVAEYVFAGTNAGPLRLPTGETIPATNKRLSISGISIASLDRSGKITSQRQYYNLLEGLTQLGLMPAPAAARA